MMKIAWVRRMKGRQRVRDKSRGIDAGEIRELPEGGVGPGDEEVRAALSRMPLMVREVYLLRMVDGLTIRQIAMRLAIPEQKVRIHLRRSVRYLMVSLRPSH